MLEYTKNLYRKKRRATATRLLLAFIFSAAGFAACKALGIGILPALIMPFAALPIKIAGDSKKRLCIVGAYAILSAIALAVIA